MLACTLFQGAKQPMRRRFNQELLVTTWNPDKTIETREFRTTNKRHNKKFEEVRDWFQSRARFEVRSLAEYCQCTEYTVYRWKAGRAPKSSNHANIAAYFAELEGRSVVDLFVELRDLCRERKNVIQ